MVQDTRDVADEVRDQSMAESARSLARYINAVGAARGLEADVLCTHVDAMQKLSFLGANQQDERCKLVDGLIAVVDKRLRRAA